MSKIFHIANSSIAAVRDSGKLFETDATFPPVLNVQPIRIFARPFTLNNDGTTVSMIVNGSVTPQQYVIASSRDYDTYIASVTIVITADLTTTDLSEFGGAVALTNGCKFYLNTADTGDVIINDALKSNFDMVRMANGYPAPGVTAGTEFKVGAINSNSDEGFFMVMRLSDYGYDREFTGGLLLRKNTEDRLIFEIRDNLNLGASSVGLFNMTAYGFQRSE